MFYKSERPDVAPVCILYLPSSEFSGGVLDRSSFVAGCALVLNVDGSRAFFCFSPRLAADAVQTFVEGTLPLYYSLFAPKPKAFVGEPRQCTYVVVGQNLGGGSS